MMKDIKGHSVVFPLYEVCATLRRPGISRDFRSDKTFAFALIAHEGIHFVVVVLRIHICANGSTPILILCFRFFMSHSHSSFAFALWTSGILAYGWYSLVGSSCRRLVVLEFYILAISKVISGWILTYDSAHSW